VNTVMNFGFHKMLGNLSSCTTGCFSRKAQLHGVNLLTDFYYPVAFNLNVVFTVIYDMTHPQQFLFSEAVQTKLPSSCDETAVRALKCIIWRDPVRPCVDSTGTPY
jgi:hypothetical protein